jgi:hypothetical protein
MIKKTLIMLLSIYSLNTYADDKKTETQKTLENFPMIFTQMSKMVGEKETVDIFIPDTSYLIDTFYPKKELEDSSHLVVSFARLRRGLGSSTSPDIAKRIINTVDTENGKLITIDLKGLKRQTFRVVADNSFNDFFNEYEFADGKVLKAKLILSKTSMSNDFEETERDYKYLAKRYNTFLDNQHFNKSLFNNGRINDKEKLYVSTSIDKDKNYAINSITLTIMNSNIQENYDKIIEDLDEKDLDNKYKELNDILK